MATDAAAGLKAGVDLARAEAGAGWPEPVEQLGLFGGAIPDADGPVEARPAREPGRPGRPPGAKNRNSQEWATFILTRFRSPLLAMAEMASRPVGDLAAELQCSREEAARVILTAARDLAPYLHSRQPQAIDMPEGAGFTIVINSGDGGAASRAGTVEAMPIEQNQVLSERSDIVSDGGHGEP